MAKKILIVDDEPNIVTLLASRIMANGYEVATAYDGVQALRQLNQENPHLVILDFKMPAGDGLTVYENIKRIKHKAGIPVIFITAYPSQEIRDEVMGMGAADFITKPFNAEELLAKIEKVLAETAYDPETGREEEQ